MIAVIKNGSDIRVIDDVFSFAYTQEDNSVLLEVKDQMEAPKINCSEFTVELMSGLDGYPYYSFLSDADKKKEAMEAAEKAASAKKDVVCESGPMKGARFSDPLAELEYHIREWCMKNGYVDDDEEWFIVRIETGYKKKVLVVTILSKENTTVPKKSIFEGKNTGEMFGKAMAFYTGGCR